VAQGDDGVREAAAGVQGVVEEIVPFFSGAVVGSKKKSVINGIILGLDAEGPGLLTADARVPQYVKSIAADGNSANVVKTLTGGARGAGD
jgi:hypothetical protein